MYKCTNHCTKLEVYNKTKQKKTGQFRDTTLVRSSKSVAVHITLIRGHTQGADGGHHYIGPELRQKFIKMFGKFGSSNVIPAKKHIAKMRGRHYYRLGCFVASTYFITLKKRACVFSYCILHVLSGLAVVVLQKPAQV